MQPDTPPISDLDRIAAAGMQLNPVNATLFAILRTIAVAFMLIPWLLFFQRGTLTAFATFSLLHRILTLSSAILWLILTYRLWQGVQPLRDESNPLPSPAKAVGFCYIPVVNFFWVFIAYPRLAKMLNRISREAPGYATNRTLLHLSAWLAAACGVLVSLDGLHTVIYARPAVVITHLDATAVLFMLFQIAHLVSMLVFALCAGKVHNRLVLPAANRRPEATTAD